MSLIANWTNQLLQELELDMDMDPKSNELSLQVNDKQAVSIQGFREDGFLLRAPLGTVSGDIEESYLEMMLGNIYLPEKLPYVLSVDADNKGYITYSQAHCSGYKQFRDDFEDFLNHMDVWTSES